MLTVLLVDGCELLRIGLKVLISEEYRVTFGEAVTGAEALVRFAKTHWDLLFINIDLPDQTGFSLLRKIRTLDSMARAHVIMLSLNCNPVYAKRAQQLGVSCCISGGLRRNDLLVAIRAALSGREEIAGSSPAVKARRAESPPHTRLSAREYQIMQVLARGKLVSEIALDLNLNIKTVSSYKRRLFNKLQLESTAELVRYVLSQKLG